MNANELYKEFLKHCKNYETDIYGIVIKNETTCLKIMKPHNPEENNYLIYEIIGKSRFSSTTSDLEELLELCVEIFGENSIIKNYGYGYK